MDRPARAHAARGAAAGDRPDAKHDSGPVRPTKSVVFVCVASVWVPCVALSSGGGSSAGSSPLCGSPMGGVLFCRVPVSRGICSLSCFSLAQCVYLITQGNYL